MNNILQTNTESNQCVEFTKKLIGETKSDFNKLFSSEFKYIFEVSTSSMSKSETHTRRSAAIKLVETNPSGMISLWDTYSGMAYGKKGVVIPKPYQVIKPLPNAFESVFRGMVILNSFSGTHSYAKA